MNNVLLVAKWALIIEAILIILFVVAAYLAKFYFVLRKHYKKKLVVKIKNMLIRCAKNNHPLSTREVRFLKRHIQLLLVNTSQHSDKYQHLPYWQQLQQQLINEVYHPKARDFATSHLFLHRYIATECFAYGINPDDEPLMVKLIKDPILLVAINAARIVRFYPLETLVNTVIDTFSAGLSQQQSFASLALASNSTQGMSFVESRLNRDENPHVKEFCYHILTIFPATQQLPASLTRDLKTDNLGLRLSIMSYLAHQATPEAQKILRDYLTDPHWQVRARVTKLLGKLQDTVSISAITERLHDPEWWVRVRAAEALARLGDQGMAVLKAQDPATDLFAYEAAIQELKKHL